MSASADAYVVLGGSGYVGLALVERLRLEGRAPILIVDLVAPSATGIGTFDPASLPDDHRPQYLKLDLTDPDATQELFAGLRAVWPGRIVVFHVAGLFVKESQKRSLVPPGEYRRQNVDAVRTVVAGLNAAGDPALLVLQSTGGLERFRGARPPDPYMRSKREAEGLVATECRVDWVNLRPVRVIGTLGEVLPPRRNGTTSDLLESLQRARADGRIPADILTDLVLDAEVSDGCLRIVLPGANSQVAFVHLHDVVRALCWAASRRTAPRRTYRVTTPPAVTFFDIGRILVEELQAVGVPATCLAHESLTPIVLSPPLSPEFAWRPSLRGSNEAVRAAVWQYLDVATRAARQP